MRDRFKVTCLSLLLVISPITAWTLEAVGPASEAVLQQLREQEDAKPTAEDLVVALNELTVRIYQDGNYALAETVAREAMVLGEREFGEEHQQTLSALNNLAALIRSQGRYGEAEPLFARALEARERVLGKDHPDTLTSVNNLAGLYQRQGRYGEAEPLYVRALEASERVLGEDHPSTLGSVNNLAILYQRQGRYGEAEPLFARALEARERVLGKDHPDTLGSVNNLALLYKSQGRHKEAEPLYVRALEASERVLGKDHPNTLVSVNNLAGLYQSQGRYGEAEPLFVRALEARERVLGKDHPDTLGRVNNLAKLYRVQGRYGEAEPLFVRALEASERVLGKDHPDTLGSVNNLAGLYRVQGRYGEAEPLFVRALEARERVLGKDHPDTLGSVNNLAGLYQRQGRYGEAEPLFVRALEARERVLGKDHPDTLSSVNNLAFLYQSQGRYGEAEPLFVRALEASERVLGKDHPDTLTTQLNLVVALINTGHLNKSLRELRRMDERLRRFVGAQLTTTLRERVRRRWLVSESSFQDVVFNLALQHPQSDTLRLAADVLLRWKRLAGESEALTARLVRSSRDPRVVEISAELRGYRARLSRLVNLPEPDKDAIAAARANVERLEVALARLSREFQGHLSGRALEWEQVQSALPRSSALLSLRAFNPVDFTTEDFGELHWLALLIPADPGDGPEIVLKDLGPVAPTVEVHRTLRETGSEEAARALYRLLFGKLDAQLAEFERLYIAPDGMLDLVAFARLMVPDGQYWAERQTLHQVRAGRDLAQQGSGKTATGGMVIFGGVDYSGFSDVGAESPTPVEAQKNKDDLLAMNRRLRDERGGFGPLKYTGVEAGAVGQFYWDHYSRKAVVWQNREATESRLKALDSPPRVLHLATHGFFLTQNAERTERPLTLAGLALAGANAGMKGSLSHAGEDGVLYALEAQDLNLEDTELVTLSACDTGRGQVDYSEGVYGLVRAFRIAGARNLLMTLWPLNDRLAADFMKDFYANWFEDPIRHPAQALQETRLAWIRSKDPKRSDPTYWAPYVLIEGR